MTLKHLPAAASAVAFIGGAAHAQDAMGPAPKNDSAPMQDATGAPAETLPSGVVNPQTSVTGEATTPEAAAQAGTDASAMAPVDSPPDAMAPTAPAASENSADASAVVQPRIVANAPIPDTPENREKYGDPLSHAGKRSAANGH